MTINSDEMLVEAGFAVRELSSLSTAMEEAIRAGDRPITIIANTLYALAQLVSRDVFDDVYGDAEHDRAIASGELLEWLKNVKPEGAA
jgi:hypothetical protein